MKKVNTVYWVCTGLFAAFMLAGSIPDVIMHPAAVELVNKHLGYPTYFLPFIGVAKVLGVVAILAPGRPALKEWAYAGFVYDLVGAMYSHISVGDAPTQWLIIFLPLLLLAGSYALHRRRLRVG
jgi:hypothetical protein